MENLVENVKSGFMWLVDSIKSVILAIWNTLVDLLGTFLPEGIDVAVAIFILAFIALYLFKLLIADKNR